MAQAPQQLTKFDLMKDQDVEDLRNTPEERCAVSLFADVDYDMQLAGVKFILFDGHEEMLFMNGTTVLMLLEFLRKPFDSRRYVDRRTNPDDPTPDEPMIQNFYNLQPDIPDELWEQPKKHLMVEGFASFEFDNAFVLVVTKAGEKVRYILPDQVAMFLMEYFEEMKKGLVDLRKQQKK